VARSLDRPFHPQAFSTVDLDFDQMTDDRMWLEPVMSSNVANAVVIDIDSNVLFSVRVGILQPRIVATIDDFDCDLVIDWVVVEKK